MTNPYCCVSAALKLIPNVINHHRQYPFFSPSPRLCPHAFTASSTAISTSAERRLLRENSIHQNSLPPSNIHIPNKRNLHFLHFLLLFPSFFLNPYVSSPSRVACQPLLQLAFCTFPLRVSAGVITLSDSCPRIEACLSASSLPSIRLSAARF